METRLAPAPNGIVISEDSGVYTAGHRSGELIAECHGRYWVLERVWVDRGERRHGIGRLLMKTFLDHIDGEFDGEEVREVALYVGVPHNDDDNLTVDEVVAWYERCGFVMKHRPTFYMLRPGRTRGE